MRTRLALPREILFFPAYRLGVTVSRVTILSFLVDDIYSKFLEVYL